MMINGKEIENYLYLCSDNKIIGYAGAGISDGINVDGDGASS